MSVETKLRERLGIPTGAKQVLVFGESSHWDTNWLRTSEEYFRDHIEAIFESIFDALQRDQRRVFSIESVFFLKMYWERHPHRQALLRGLLNTRRLRLLSASITTPDTLLPPTETILRDFLAGQMWLKENGIELFPTVAYFPDNFGHSPALPSLMRSLGVSGVGVTRIDGMYFVASDYRRRSHFPLKGSTAQQLQKDHKTLDFVWRSEDGAEVLCHWNAFTYFQGDMLAHAGVIRWMGKTFGLPWRTRSHVVRRINRYVRELSALSLTPYMFCPIGCDFNHPIVDIGELIDRYNAEVYPQSGIYVALAGLDDYLALVDCHREKLPVLAADPNPYWMGFYSSRPEVKQRPTRISRTLVLAEKLSASAPADPHFRALTDRAWNMLLLSNHHDYITGTSPDRIWESEQRSWLEEAESAAAAAWSYVAPALPQTPARQTPPLHHHLDGDELVVESAHYRFVISGKRGGCLTSFTDSDGRDVLDGLGNDLIVYADSGGLWRLGHEFAGGSFKVLARASDGPAGLVVHDHSGELTISISSSIAGRPFTRTIWCRSDSPFLRMRVAGAVKTRWTVSASFATSLRNDRLIMDGPGGHADRPIQKHYDPTFWPVSSHCQVHDARTNRHGHFLFDSPAALAFRDDGRVEWIVARNAAKERAFGFLPVLAHPIGGSSDEEQSFDYAVGFGCATGEPQMNAHREGLFREWLPTNEREAWRLAHAFILCDDPQVKVTAVKHAHDGDGVIVRLTRRVFTSESVSISCFGRRIGTAWLADAREQNCAPLPVEGGSVQVPMRYSVSTIRVRFAE
jgi:hypothetical protein